MSHLDHPNTVKVFNYGELEDGSLYIVMEFLEGKNLHQTVRKGGPLAYERGSSDPDPGLRCAGRGAPKGHHPPGSQAREHLLVRRSVGQVGLCEGA